MPWVRFDDQFPIHRKVKGLSDAEYRLHTEAIFWCARNRTDGYVAGDELRDVSGISKPERHLPELVRRGLWEERDGGWMIHDYLIYQFSRERIEATHQARVKTGQQGGLASGAARRRSKTEAKPKQIGSGSLQPRSSSTKKKTGSAAPSARGTPATPHTFVDDGDGNCTQCKLPEKNRRVHR